MNTVVNQIIYVCDYFKQKKNHTLLKVRYGAYGYLFIKSSKLINIISNFLLHVAHMCIWVLSLPFSIPL